MAAPRKSPQHPPPTESEGSRLWHLYNFLLWGSKKEKRQEYVNPEQEDAKDVADVPVAWQSPKDVVQDDSLAKYVNIRKQPVDVDHPPELSRPPTAPLTPRHTPPHLSPISEPGFQAACYDDPRCGTESEVSNPASPQLPSYQCWKYELLPTSDSSPTAIRAKLTRSFQDDDDSNHDDKFSSEENDSSEDGEDALCQQNGPLHVNDIEYRNEK